MQSRYFTTICNAAPRVITDPELPDQCFFFFLHAPSRKILVIPEHSSQPPLVTFSQSISDWQVRFFRQQSRQLLTYPLLLQQRFFPQTLQKKTRFSIFASLRMALAQARLWFLFTKKELQINSNISCVFAILFPPVLYHIPKQPVNPEISIIPDS